MNGAASHRASRLVRRVCLASIAAVAGLLLMAGIAGPRAEAQSPGLLVRILTPGDGQTFYAGPQVLQYNLQVTGWVKSEGYEPGRIDVRLEAFQGRDLVGTLVTHPDADGSFKFALSVNPGAHGGQSIFNAEHDSCPSCHYPGDLALAGGESVLRVTATDPGQRRATAERRVTVDRSSVAAVPVQIVDERDADRQVPNVRVTGSAWLYMWRARNSSAMTDGSGRAVLSVEALTASPTDYVLHVEPTIVDGVLYEGTAPVTITLPRGATSAPPARLAVRARTGQLAGTLAPPVAVPVRLVRLPDGMSYATASSADGTFLFPALPIGRYLVAADRLALASQGLAAAAPTVDLAAAPSATVSVPVVAIGKGSAIAGTLTDARGAPLPFGWLTIDPAGVRDTVAPDSGRFALVGPESASYIVVASAPGYYSQARVVDGGESDANWSLTIRPETRTVPWGSGQIVVPPESQVSIAPDDISLSYGWLWGAGGADRALTIRLPDMSISMASGRLAIEYLPDRSSWLYVFDGAASVQGAKTRQTAVVRSGEMLALALASPAAPAPFDPAAVAALHSPVQPVAPVWEPSLDAQVRDRLAQMGIGVAQATTFLTYALVILALVFAPFVVLLWSRRSR